MGVTQIKEWFNRFKHGCMSADSEQRSGRLSRSRNSDVIEKVRTLIMEDCPLAIHEVADEVGISRGSANTILTEDLGARRMTAKFVPKLLSPEQQQLRLEVALDMLECTYRDPDHTSLLVREFQAKHHMATLPQPPYSPDLAPANFFLFPRIKTALKGRHFESIQAIQAAVTTALNEVPVEAFEGAYRAWESRWQK
ncbi:hypothetical protein B7P43_G15437 [Cryptotermes secundus]|uniref:Mos1 transposase HTH domain-containing protein n=1 Tax=Cryptotermes secundus TaxID=105785 RepID=A0A2J7PV94_9NEOP|nr:hypothetical protein B7P43_G15437 [Cryptotermes secundus]